MDWLSQHMVIIDCREKKIKICTMGFSNLVIYGRGKKMLLISAMQAHRLMKKGCVVYLAMTLSATTKAVKLQDIPVVNEYPDVFSEDLPGLPPNREIEFTIDFLTGMEPISRALYQMTISEL
ncbi:hypothetical protein AXF42_Ash021521 [Apostasia shenzhenica]|uniref:Uncharacterized protein n=1 Tax=Apostasia shenzhenica TaxID=1088818 RepID=A0A2H9ZTW9_9ASPA|nr:hypothetical protein AXF42_Ash021521 [Apostasia shenzhenica]